MIPPLLGLYLVLIGVVAWGSYQSFLLKRRFAQPFLNAFHLFVLFSFAYAIVNYIGEVLIPSAFPGSSESLVPAYLIVDLITIPLWGVLFFLLFSWITRLLGRPVPGRFKAAFGGIELLFLASFIVSIFSYFRRGISTGTAVATLILNGVILALLSAAVLLLLLGVPAGNDPVRRRLARKLGMAYALSFAISAALALLARTPVFRDAGISRILAPGFIFLVNLPALFILRGSPAAWPRDPDGREAEGLESLARETGISGREKEILQLVARGLDNREIGKTLFISPKTVKNHLTSIYAKTGARNRVQLANRLNKPEKDSALPG